MDILSKFLSLIPSQFLKEKNRTVNRFDFLQKIPVFQKIHKSIRLLRMRKNGYRMKIIPSIILMTFDYWVFWQCIGMREINSITLFLHFILIHLWINLNLPDLIPIS